MIIGIDLGTTNSCVAIWRNNKLEIIPDKYGNNTLPSIVAFTKKTKYIGYSAKNQKELNPSNVFYEVKRLIGRKITDISDISDYEYFSYEICVDDNNLILLKSDFGIHSPEEISAMILIELKQMACLYLGEEVTDAVITVPAYFTDVQRQATKDAAKIAGLNVIRIINEPTAAALAYGLGIKNDVNILVYDLGGGTLDISILNVHDGTFEVIASSGNTHLGGADFDARLLTYCLKTHYKDYDEIPPLSSLALQNLKNECENVKKLLSNVKKTHIVVKNFNNERDLKIEITQKIFDELCSDLYINCLDPLNEILKSCKMSPDEIDEIILVGGATRMPKIRENIKNYFKKEPNFSVNPDEIVAMGASIMGYILQNKNDPFSESIVLMDVTTLSLGVETLDGIMNVVVPRNTVIPTTKKKLYTTSTDNEESVNINIYEGERKLIKDNVHLGSFELVGLDPMPRGYAKISVSFKIDSSGIIEVTAEDLRDGNMNYVKVISNKNNMSDDKINELLEKAKFYEENDKNELTIKTLRYELLDLLKVIKYNLTTIEMSDEEKNIILSDINNINIKNDEINEELLRKHISTLQEKYFGLCTIINNNIKANNQNNMGTNIYNDQDDEIKYESPNLKSNITNNIINNNEDIKYALIDLCINMLDNLKLAKLDMERENEIKYIIDDVLLWANVQYKIIRNEYEEKINYINNLYNEIFQNNNENNISSELEILCFESLKNDNGDKEKVNDILEWLLDMKARVCVGLMEMDYEACREKINILRNIMTNIN